MGMKVIKLEGKDSVEVFAANAITNVRGVLLQNKTNGSVFIWLDANKPTNYDDGFLLASGEMFQIEVQDGTKCWLSGKGLVVAKF